MDGPKNDHDFPRKRVDAADPARDELLAYIASCTHGMRGQLNIASGYLQMIEAQGLAHGDPLLCEYLTKITRALDAMGSILEQSGHLVKNSSK